MKLRDPYAFVAAVKRVNGDDVDRVRIEIDWAPAVQSASIAGVRVGQVEAMHRYVGEFSIEPVWDPDRGAPYVDEFVLALHDGSEAPFRHMIPRAFVSGAVQRAASTLVTEGKLEDGEVFKYEVCGYPTSESRPSEEAVQFEPVPQPLTLVTRSLAALRDISDVVGEEDDAAFPVFVVESVMEDAKDLARRYDDREGGGILVGNLYRDEGSPEIFALVNALIEARHTVSEERRLTFTPDTWAAARAAVDLRQDGEVILGWLHNHPYFCAKCSEEARRRCPYRKPFFSADDTALHGACFPSGFQMALLVSNLGPGGLQCDMFGWNRGVVERRGFRSIRWKTA